MLFICIAALLNGKTMIFYNQLRLANLINDFLLSTVIIRRLIETLTYLNHRKLTRFVLQFFRTKQLSFDEIDTSYNHKHFKNKCMQLEEKTQGFKLVSIIFHVSKWTPQISFLKKNKCCLKHVKQKSHSSKSTYSL